MQLFYRGNQVPVLAPNDVAILDGEVSELAGSRHLFVRIQISAAITAHCLVAIVQHDMKLKRSTYEVLQILSISHTGKTSLRVLFNKTYSNDVKEQSGPLIP